jgi:hypothetical protein
VCGQKIAISFPFPSRLYLYDMTQSRVTLTAQHGSDQHQVLVCTKLVEPFQAQVGSLYMVLGELEHQEGKPSLIHPGCLWVIFWVTHELGMGLVL